MRPLLFSVFIALNAKAEVFDVTNIYLETLTRNALDVCFG